MASKSDMLGRLAQLERRKKDLRGEVEDLQRELKEIDRDEKIVRDALQALEPKKTKAQEPGPPAKVN